MTQSFSTFKIGRDGDYLLEEGENLVRKLIIRRLITRPGEFFHLPDYGIGLRIKEPLPGQIASLKKQIEQQAELEPEVESAVASLSFSNSILIIQLRVRLLQTGADIEIGIRRSDDELVVF